VTLRANHRDLFERAAWTFLQAFLATLALGGFTDWPAARSAVVGAIAAGLSAVKTVLRSE